MNWHERRSTARRRAVGKYDTAEAEAYGQLQGLGWLTADEERAYLADVERVVHFASGASVLDVRGLDIVDPVGLERAINQIPGVVTNGLFAQRGADVLVIGTDAGVQTLRPSGR